MQGALSFPRSWWPRIPSYVRLGGIVLLLVVAVAAVVVALQSSGGQTPIDAASVTAQLVEQPLVTTGPDGAVANDSQVVEPQARSSSLSSAAPAPQVAEGNAAVQPTSAEIPVSQIEIPLAMEKHRPVVSTNQFYKGAVGNPDVSDPQVFTLLNSTTCSCQGYLNALSVLKTFLEHTYRGELLPIWGEANAYKFVEDPALVDTTQAVLRRVYWSLPTVVFTEAHQFVEPDEVITVDFYLFHRGTGGRVNAIATMAWRQKILQWKILDLVLSEVN